MFVSEQVKPSLAEFSHHGVKGMHWGVRKAYGNRLQSRTQYLDRVASGGGTRRDKVRVALTTNAGTLIKGRGLQGAAKIDAKRRDDYVERLTSGHAKIRDVLAFAGTVRIDDIIKGRPGKSKS